MGLLHRFENRLEAVVSGAFARAFRSSVQPVELAAALQREVDNNAQVLSRERRLVPNNFHIELSSGDYGRLEPYASSLTAELTDVLRNHAEEQSYVFAGPVHITFEEAGDLGTGRFRVRSKAAASVAVSPDLGPSVTTAEPDRPDSETPTTSAPRPSMAAFLEVNGVRQPLAPPGLVIGRGAEADVRINDPGVSRRHAEIQVTNGSTRPNVTVVDLGSTNGTHVNGYRIDRAALTEGSEVSIGNTTLTVRFVPEASDVPEGDAGDE